MSDQESSYQKWEEHKARAALELVPELVKALWTQHYDMSDLSREYFCLGSCDVGHDKDCSTIRAILAKAKAAGFGPKSEGEK